jgi:hypothetical protein
MLRLDAVHAADVVGADHKSGAATMLGVRRSYSAADVAAEAGCLEEGVRWLAEIGLLTAENGRFTFGAVVAAKMATALMESGITADTIEHAAAEGLLGFKQTDEYLPHEPGARSDRTFAEFQADAGSRAELLPAVYEVLGLPKPDPSTPIHADEEAMFERFLQVWRSAPDEDSLLRAARLLAEGTRAAMLGWANLVYEQVAEPAERRLFRGELDEFPERDRRHVRNGDEAGAGHVCVAERPIPRATQRDPDRRGVRTVPRLARARAASGPARPACDRLRRPIRLYAPHSRAWRRVRCPCCDVAKTSSTTFQSIFDSASLPKTAPPGRTVAQIRRHADLSVRRVCDSVRASVR